MSQSLEVLDVYNENNHIFFVLSIIDYPDDNTSNYNQEYIMQVNSVPILVNKGKHIEMSYGKLKDYTGKAIIW